MKALLIDPDPERRQTLAAALQRQGFELAATEDAEAACQLQKTECRPLVVLAADPWERGMELCRRLRGDNGHRLFWMLASAQRCSAGRVADLLAAGADDVLLLPLEEPSLHARLALAKQRVESLLAGRTAANRDLDHEAADEGSPAYRPQAMLRSLIENIPHPVFVLDADGFVHFSNHTLFHAGAELVAETHCSKYFAPPHVPPLLHMAKRAMDTGRNQVVPAADHWGNWWECRVFPIVEAGAADKVLLLCTDMTERQRAVDLLRESEQRYHLIAENVTDLIWIAEFDKNLALPTGLDADAARQWASDMLRRWRFTYVSPSVERALGFAAPEFLALDLDTLLTAESGELMRQFLAEELAIATATDKDSRRSRSVEVQQYTKDGAICHGEVTATFLRDEEGRITGVLGVTRDITLRRQAEEALRESEATLRGLVQNLPDFVAVVDRQGLIQYVNRGVESLAASDLIARPAFDYLRPEFRSVVQDALGEAFESGNVREFEVIDVFGSYWSCRAVPISDGAEVHDAMIICADVTEKKHAEAEVQKEQDLLRQMLELLERDRELAAFEIHDGVAQQMTGAMLNFEASAQLAKTSPDEAKRTYREGLRLLRQSIEEARRLISGLRPPVLDSFGIIPAIEHLIRQATVASGLDIELQTAGQFDRLARPLENAVFRIVQESLTNACRYSETERICVDLNRVGDRIRIAVRDWGVGFDPEQVPSDHFGLRGIRERARLLGGTSSIETAPGKGTCIVVELPLVLQAATRH